MRLLFKIDTSDYDKNGTAFVRPSSRCIAIKDGKVAMVYSKKYDYYKFPGGGIESGESREDALIRETLEEAGLAVVSESIREFGYVHRIQKSGAPDADFFVQDNFYYLCDVRDEAMSQKLDDYEESEGFTPVWVLPDTAIKANRKQEHGPKDPNMIEREVKVLEILKAEGYFD